MPYVPSFKQHAGQQHAARRRRFDMRQRQPRVQREHGHFTMKPTEIARNSATCQLRIERMLGQPMGKSGNRRRRRQAGRRCDQHQRHESHQRHQAADKRVQKEFDRRITPLRPAPNADQEEQRNQRELEKHVEQNQVERREHADQSRFQQQQTSVETGRPFANRLPRNQHAGNREQRRQHDQQPG